MSEPTFNEELHEYRYNGQVIPSVTQVIKDVIGIGWEASPWHLQRGTAVHLAVQLWADGKLDLDSLDERIRGRVDSIIKFLNDSKAFIHCSEKRGVSVAYGFAGTVDMVASINEKLVICDWKGSIDPRARIQLGAYQILMEESFQKSDGVAVQCFDSGKYKCMWMNRREMDEGKRAFLAALSVYNYKKRHKIQ